MEYFSIPGISNAAGPATAANNTRFGSVTVNHPSQAVFWLVMGGAGFLLWKMLQK